MTRLTLPALALALMLGTAARPAPEPPQADGKVTLQDIKYDDLGKFIRSQKGKVVVVDFWGEY
jgi:hypothetical protein